MVQLNEKLSGEAKKMVRDSVEKTLNELLEAEAGS